MILPKGTVSFSRWQPQGGRMKKGLVLIGLYGVFIGRQKKMILKTRRRMNQGVKGARMMMGRTVGKGLRRGLAHRHRKPALMQGIGRHGPGQTRPNNQNIIETHGF
jgi:hypothetical protein